MNKQGLPFIWMPVLFLLLLAGCIEKELDFNGIKTQNWNSEWALPLINSRLGINDLLNDSVENIQEGEDGLISLVYESEKLVSVKASEIASIPDQTKNISENFDLPAIPSGIEGTVPVQFKFTFELDQANLRVDSILLKNGQYNFKLKTNLDQDITSIDFEVPNLQNIHTGETLQFMMDIDPNAGGIIEKDTLFDLSEYKIVFENSFIDTNQVFINGLVHFISDGEPPNNPYFIELENNFNAMDFNKFFGYAGKREIHMNDTIRLNIFDVNQEGNFTFGEGSVNLNIDIQNSFGLPVLLNIATFRAYHGEGLNADSLDIFIFGEGNPSEISLNYPAVSQVGQSIYTNVNTDNSNMNEALSISPHKLYINIDGYLNPDEDPALPNFILDSSVISADLSVELRLFGSVNAFTIADTVDFNLDNIDQIENLEFAIEIENGFPINANVQLNFVDSVYHVLHTLLPLNESLMTAAQVGTAPDYRVTNPSVKQTMIALSPDEIDNVTAAEKILINATLSTTGNELVKIYSDYTLNLKLGAKVGIKL